jgi:hypothetical protein
LRCYLRALQSLRLFVDTKVGCFLTFVKEQMRFLSGELTNRILGLKCIKMHFLKQKYLKMLKMLILNSFLTSKKVKNRVKIGFFCIFNYQKKSTFF